MKLDSIKLHNYRCFEDLQIDFDENLTVLIANNGQGKTAILDAIRITLWPFIKSFDLARSKTFNDPSNSISIDDVTTIKMRNGTMARQLPCEVTATGDWGMGKIETWTRSRISERPGTKTRNDKKSKFLERIASALQNQIRDPHIEEQDLPMLGYYGTGRLWAQKKLIENTKESEKDSSSYIRSFGYKNCMDPASTYKHFKDWFIWAWSSWSNALTRSSATDAEISDAKNRISIVQQAVDTVLEPSTGWHTLEYSVEDEESLILSHPKHGRIKVDQMSDGIRSIVALIADIAYRCIKLNPQLKEHALTDTNGIVLIDEVDMHLHPSWQQIVVGALREAFPKIQFIVTTHSPQVLSTVPKECIRVLGENSEGKAIAQKPLAASYGEPSNDVLQAIMHVDPQPPVPEKKLLDELTSLVDQGDYPSQRADELLAKLKQKLHENHPQLLRIERSIRRQKALKG